MPSAFKLWAQTRSGWRSVARQVSPFLIIFNAIEYSNVEVSLFTHVYLKPRISCALITSTRPVKMSFNISV